MSNTLTKLDEVSRDPIFVVGMNGSGTTMLVHCLNQHSQIYGFPRETKFIPHFIEKAQGASDLEREENFLRLWNEYLASSKFRAINDGAEVPIPDDWRDLPRDIATIIDQTFLHFARKEGKSRWCEKTPRYALHMPLLAAAFPGAKFIHIYRDGRDCAASFHRRWDYRPERTMVRWKNVVRRARREGRNLGQRYYELRYEDLTHNPEQKMRGVCEFLGVPFEEPVLIYEKRRPREEIPAKRAHPSDRIVPNSEKWRTYFSSAQIASLDCIAGSLLDELDYPTEKPNGNRNPPAWLLGWWQFLDLSRQTITHALDSSRTTPLSERIRNAIRQKE